MAGIGRGVGFFESITLAATVFTLLVAFRVARLSSRTSEEDNRVFSVYRKLDLLARRGVINPEACDYILEIDRANNDASTAKEAYYKVRRLIAEVDAKSLDEAEVQLLSDAGVELGCAGPFQAVGHPPGGGIRPGHFRHDHRRFVLVHATTTVRWVDASAGRLGLRC